MSTATGTTRRTKEQIAAAIARDIAEGRLTAIPVDLPLAQHRESQHLARNPQGLVPTIEIGGEMLTQSLAIIEYLHETNPDSLLLPADPRGRARVRQLSHLVAMDIHPVCNSSVVTRVVELAGGNDEQRQAWMREFITKGLDALESLVGSEASGRCCHGDDPTMADCCLVPQFYNARLWGCDSARWPRLLAIDAVCAELEPLSGRSSRQDRGTVAIVTTPESVSASGRSSPNRAAPAAPCRPRLRLRAPSRPDSRGSGAGSPSRRRFARRRRRSERGPAPAPRAR